MSTLSPFVLTSNGQIRIGMVIFILVGVVMFLFHLLHIPLYSFLTAFLVAIVFFVAFLDTQSALIILIFSMLLSPEFAVGGVRGHAVIIRAEDIFLIVVFIGWLAKVAVNKELGVLKKTPLNLPIVVYVSVALLSTGLQLIEFPQGFASAFFFFLKYVEYYFLFFLVVNNLHSIDEAKMFVSLLLLTCFLVCVFGVYQIPHGARVTAPFQEAGGEPNTLSGYLILMIALIISLVLYIKSFTRRIVLIALGGLAVLVFVYTLSRGGWLAFFPMFVTFLIANKRHRYVLMFFLVVMLIALPRLAPREVHERFQDAFSDYKTYTILGKKFTVSESGAARIDSLTLSFKRLMAKPVFGYGVAGSIIDNQYARVLTETGVVGMMAWLFLISRIFKAGWRAYATEDDDFVKAVSVGLVAGLVGLLVHSLASATFILIRVMEPFWFLTAIMVMLPALRRQQQQGSVEHGDESRIMEIESNG